MPRILVVEAAAGRLGLDAARAHASDREAGACAGADACLVKPFSPMVPVDTVRRLLAGRRPQSAR